MPRRGKTKYENMFPEGYKFGSWELIDSTPVRLQKGKNFYYHYLVRCECGLEKLTDCSQLVSGVTKKCIECGQKTLIGSGNPYWKGHGLIPGKRFYRAKKSAEMRGIPFNIDIEIMNEVLEKNGFVCAISGVSLDKDTWSLDRINSKEGYTRENIQYVHKDINIMKNKYSQEYFIKMCKAVAETAGGACEVV